MLHLISVKLLEHLELACISLVIAAVIAIPLGVYLAIARGKRMANGVIRMTASLQAVPGLALLALLVALLSLSPLPSTGFLPATIVLVLYALFPILTAAHDGVKRVSHSVVEAAVAMGMEKKEMLFHVQLPLAFPHIIGGLRIAFVWIIGLVTLTSLVGSGGLGDLIVQGLRTMQVDLILAGTIPAVCMTLLFDWLLTRAAEWVSPRKMR